MPEKKHSFTATEIKAGLLVILSAVVLVGFVAVIQGMRPPQKVKVYYATFTKTIGLKIGAEVHWGGILAGRVTAIEPDPEDQTLIKVEASVAPHIPVNQESVATIEQISLTSEKHLEISTGVKQALPLPEGATIRSVTLTGAFIELPDVNGVVTKVEDLLDDLMAFLGVEEAQELEEKGEREFAKITRITADVREALDKGTGLVEDITDVLEEQRPNINDILEKVKGLEDSVKELADEVNGLLEDNRQPLTDTMAGVKGIVDDVGGVVDSIAGELDALVSSLQGTLENADGLSANARDFLEDNRPAIEDMILDLRETVRYLKSFSRTMAEQPQAVIRGKAPEGRKN